MKSISDTKLKYLIDKFKRSNVYSATRLENSRTFQVDADKGDSVAKFDGTNNVVLGINGVLPTENGGTGVQSLADLGLALGLLKCQIKSYTGDDKTSITHKFTDLKELLMVVIQPKSSSRNTIIVAIKGVNKIGLLDNTSNSDYWRGISFDGNTVKLTRQHASYFLEDDVKLNQYNDILNNLGAEYIALGIGY